jgi:hypothetical protein
VVVLAEILKFDKPKSASGFTFFPVGFSRGKVGENKKTDKKY